MNETAEIWVGDASELAADLPAPIHCIIADPPYGVNFRSHQATTPAGLKLARELEGDLNLVGAIALFDNVMGEIIHHVADDCELYVFTRWDILHSWVRAIESISGFKYKMLLVWDKGNPGMGDIDGNWGCGYELIIYAKRGRRDVPYRRSAILGFERVHPKKIIHPTEKPVPLMGELIKVSTAPGELVVDPFCGSGSAIVAARNLGRRAIGIEKDAEFARNAKSRLEQGSLLLS